MAVYQNYQCKLSVVSLTALTKLTGRRENYGECKYSIPANVSYGATRISEAMFKFVCHPTLVPGSSV